MSSVWLVDTMVSGSRGIRLADAALALLDRFGNLPCRVERNLSDR
jgi:hypothetical protein